MPTRQTLKRGIRVSEAVVARIDKGVATRLGERRARLRQQEADGGKAVSYYRYAVEDG